MTEITSEGGSGEEEREENKEGGGRKRRGEKKKGRKVRIKGDERVGVQDSSMVHTSSVAANSCPLSPESTCIGSTAAASAEDCPSVSMATILSGELTKSVVEFEWKALLNLIS